MRNITINSGSVPYTMTQELCDQYQQRVLKLAKTWKLTHIQRGLKNLQCKQVLIGNSCFLSSLKCSKKKKKNPHLTEEVREEYIILIERRKIPNENIKNIYLVDKFNVVANGKLEEKKSSQQESHFPFAFQKNSKQDSVKHWKCELTFYFYYLHVIGLCPKWKSLCSEQSLDNYSS